ncbi:hypothetical protein RAZWK3B_11612 [Roseobacter sp. AzwK-3b]|uniref:hypothetical protein n=1 Tax=Roseobacter sp. AzwK-3b TaxID=351016 RepID=UPI000156A1AE|nr:hypothetical protein [Roseobacter sp. AzwK-3b]EDM69383.1 hypothetical protein RAZWK3B_11612 [Roseobacter sp. AzwK-3b]
MRWLGHMMRFLLLLLSRVTLIGAVVGGIAAAWGYYGYQRIGCHPMFSSANIECGTVQVMSAEHSLAMVRVLAPYQQQLRDNQTELMLYGGIALLWAVVIELAFGVFAIMRRRRTKRDLFKGATDIKAEESTGPL